MDINWRQEYEAAVIERNGLIMALMAAEKRESAALSRAEAAEQRVAELEAQRDDYHMKWVDVGFELGQFADDLIAVLKLQLTDNDDEATTLATIVTRVTELEAQLAATAWRPVTEPPIEDGWYDVYAPDFKDYGEFQDTARWERSEWFVYGEPISPTHWAKLRPAPTPPPAATE